MTASEVRAAALQAYTTLTTSAYYEPPNSEEDFTEQVHLYCHFIDDGKWLLEDGEVQCPFPNTCTYK
jgi:hypothetical protein